MLIVSSHLVDELEAMIDDAVFMQNGVRGAGGLRAAHSRAVRRRHRGNVPAHLWGRRCERPCLTRQIRLLRKNRTALLVLLAIAAALEAYFLISIAREASEDVYTAIALLTLLFACVSFAVFILGVSSYPGN